MIENLTMNLSMATKILRTAKGMKQKEVASKLGVTANYVSLVENGSREPSVSYLRGLARILGVPVGLFFLWEQPEPGPLGQRSHQVRDLIAQLETMYLLARRDRVSKQRSAS